VIAGLLIFGVRWARNRHCRFWSWRWQQEWR